MQILVIMFFVYFSSSLFLFVYFFWINGSFSHVGIIIIFVLVCLHCAVSVIGLAAVDSANKSKELNWTELNYYLCYKCVYITFLIS
jgi:hypothetical protein